MKEKTIPTEMQESNQWSTIQRRLEEDANSFKQPVSESLHQRIMSGIKEAHAESEEVIVRFNYLPYLLAIAACICAAILIVVNNEPVEPDIPLFAMEEFPDMILEQVTALISYDNELEKLQADMKSGFQFFLSTVDLEDISEI